MDKYLVLHDKNVKKSKKKEKILHYNASFPDPGSKQKNVDRSLDFNTFYIKNIGKEDEIRTNLTDPIDSYY